MNLAAFEAEVARVWDAIPEALKHDVVALVVEPGVAHDPEFPDTLRLGECMIDPALAMVPEAPVRSLLYIYYGSFVAAAAREPRFHWIDEIEETVHHELRHHLDWREGHDALGLEDDLERENMLRLDGQPFVRDFYRLCPRMAPGVTRLGRELFVEAVLDRKAWRTLAAGRRLAVAAAGAVFRSAPLSARPDAKIVYLDAVDVDESALREGGTLAADDWEFATIVARRKRLLEFGAPPSEARVERVDEDAKATP